MPRFASTPGAVGCADPLPRRVGGRAILPRAHRRHSPGDHASRSARREVLDDGAKSKVCGHERGDQAIERRWWPSARRRHGPGSDGRRGCPRPAPLTSAFWTRQVSPTGRRIRAATARRVSERFPPTNGCSACRLNWRPGGRGVLTTYPFRPRRSLGIKPIGAQAHGCADDSIDTSGQSANVQPSQWSGGDVGQGSLTDAQACKHAGGRPQLSEAALAQHATPPARARRTAPPAALGREPGGH